MSFDTAKKCIDWIFANVPENADGVELGFIGGEPLVEFSLIKQIFGYVESLNLSKPHIFYATTNGTLLDDEKKRWFSERRKRFVLGLSLDGKAETHNHNRSNSFSKIDLDFFLKNWPEQGIKMTLSEFSLDHLAENVIFAHERGFKQISGVNLFEGTFDWSKEEFIKKLIPQLEQLVAYYVKHDELKVNQMFDKKIQLCESSEKRRQRWCGIGSGAIFFDVDGKRHPCTFCSPMTFDEKTLAELESHDFEKTDDFIDEDCFANCYLYPVCPHCAAANYLTKKTFKTRDKSRCRIQKLISLYVADLLGKRILKNPNRFDEKEKYLLITAIQKIKQLYLDDFKEYLNA